MTAAPARASARRSWGWLAVIVVAGIAVGTGTAAFVVQSGSGSAGGVQTGSQFLMHWQQTGVISATTPDPVPALASVAVALPTRLTAASSSFALDAATAGHEAVEWVFSETAGIATSQEIEVAVQVTYTVGTVAHSVAVEAYLETQVAAIGETLTFDLYWDSGAATGVTFASETEISQACSAVGSCP